MVGREQRGAVSGHALGALGLHAPPAVVEKAEERLDEVGELLVEAPLVLRVVALHPLQQPLDRRSGVARERGRAARDRLGQVEAGFQALAQATHEGERGLGHAAAAPRGRARTQSSTAPTVE